MHNNISSEISKAYEIKIRKTIIKGMSEKKEEVITLSPSLKPFKDYFFKETFEIRTVIFEEEYKLEEDIFYRFGFVLKQNNKYFLGWIIVSKELDENAIITFPKIQIEKEINIVEGLIPSEENLRRFLKRELLRRKEIVLRIEGFENYTKF